MNLSGGKNKYVCLYSLVKRECPDLYKSINELCIDGIFRNQRYKNTFLMPDAKLCKHIQSMIDADKDEEAIQAIKSLIIKGHHTKASFKKGATVGTLNDDEVLSDPEAVAEHLTGSDKSTYTKEDHKVTVVLNYKGDKPPATKKVETKVPSERVGAGPSSQKHMNTHHSHLSKTMDKLHDKSSAKKTFKNYSHAVAKLLALLEGKNELHHAKHFLAANPVLSFAFLTMNGHQGALISTEDLNTVELNGHDGDLDLLEKCLGEPEFERSLFTETNKERAKLIQEKCEKSTLPGAIHDSYKKLINKASKDMQDEFKDSIDVKLLMDELRFLYEDAISCEEDFDDAITHLKSINWDSPKTHSIMTDPKVYKNLLKCQEAFVSGPLLFVKSVYFMYIPINDNIQASIEKAKSGGSNWGGVNPSSLSSVVFKGGKARSSMKHNASKHKMSSIKKMLTGLSKAQKEELKKHM
jgi:hypothetical protein